MKEADQVTWDVLTGDCRDLLAQLPAGSVHTVVTSPPYFGLRDYGTGEWEGGDEACDHIKGRGGHLAESSASTRGGGHKVAEAQTIPYGDACGRCGATRKDQQLGLEPTPQDFVDALVQVFREVRRVLRDDGTVWLNLGDSYNSNPTSSGAGLQSRAFDGGDAPAFAAGERAAGTGSRKTMACKPKDLLGIPWMVAFALRADGWYLRADIIWNKPNPMPESVTDRPTRSHEFIFLLSKNSRYFYDADSIREDAAPSFASRGFKAETQAVRQRVGSAQNGGTGERAEREIVGRNKRDVWTVSTKPFSEAHFATFPPDLIEPCVLAGCPERACSACGAPWERIVEREGTGRTYERGATPADHRGMGAAQHSGSGSGALSVIVTTLGFEPSCSCNADPAPGTVLDPFAGAGTTGLVAARNRRAFIGLELNPEYAQMARDRIETDIRLGHRAPQRVEVDPGQIDIFEALS
jgi:DNA modification methylase